MIKKLVFLITAPLLMAVTGCPNAFVESAQKTTDDALLYSAEQHANANEWTEAITAMNSMTTTGKAKRESKAALASYYAGRCGLNLLDFAQSIKDQMPATKIWALSLRAQAGATVADLADCVLAEQTSNWSSSRLQKWVPRSRSRMPTRTTMVSSTARSTRVHRLTFQMRPCKSSAVDSVSLSKRFKLRVLASAEILRQRSARCAP